MKSETSASSWHHRRSQSQNIKIVFQLLPKGDKLKLSLIILAQLFFTAIDLVGIALFSLTFGLITTNGDLPEGGRLSKFLELLPFSDLSGSQLILVIGVAALCALVIKSTASLFLSRKIYSFFALRAALISSYLLRNFVEASVAKLEKRSLQEIVFSTSEGVQTLFIKGLANIIIIVSELVLISFYLLILATVNIQLALFLVLYFGLITFLILKSYVGPTKALGKYATELHIESAELTRIVVDNYRALFVTQKLEKFVNDFAYVRLKFMQTLTKRIAQAAVSKYVLELSFIFSILFMAVFLFKTNSATSAIVILSLFVGASFRITPSILRIQQEYLSLRGALSSAGPTISLLKDLPGKDVHFATQDKVTKENYASDFVPEIKVRNLQFAFGVQGPFSLDEINFDVVPGTLTALVGPSGAGKSTLFDLILGIRKPNSGEILLSGFEPKLAMRKWRGHIAFVPQDTQVFSGSIRDNILLEIGAARDRDESLKKAIRQSGLEEFLDWPNQLDTQIGGAGVRLSGGQRQRLAIARALISNPSLILMDEPTSSLDAITEQRIFGDLEELRKGRTLFVIAHRLSTVRNAETVIYMDHGRIRSIGSFDETRERIPEFEKQANLFGIL